MVVVLVIMVLCCVENVEVVVEVGVVGLFVCMFSVLLLFIRLFLVFKFVLIVDVGDSGVSFGEIGVIYEINKMIEKIGLL